MSTATDELRSDHALVERALGLLGGMAQHVRRGGSFPAEDSATILRFLREFLVATHFRKENEVVWPALAMRADEEAAAAVGRLMFEQEETVELINTLLVFWEPAGELTDPERLGFADTVEALHNRVGLMLESEERLFTCCERCIPADDRIDWSEQFGAVAAARTSRERWAMRLRAVAENWQV